MFYPTRETDNKLKTLKGLNRIEMERIVSSWENLRLLDLEARGFIKFFDQYKSFDVYLTNRGMEFIRTIT